MLHPALAKIAHAKLKHLANLLGGGGLGDGDQRHLAYRGYSADTRLPNPVSNFVQFFCQRRSLGHLHPSSASNTKRAL